MADAIKQPLQRPGDLGGRYGGEEFLILLPNTDNKGAVGIAEKIRMALEEMAVPHAKSDVAAHVTMSFG